MKRALFTVFLLLLCTGYVIGATGCAEQEKKSDKSDSEKKYTYEELIQLDAEDLLALFQENGLVIPEELLEVMSEDEIATILKSEFDLWICGYSSLNYTAYCELEDNVREVYTQLTGEVREWK